MDFLGNLLSSLLGLMSLDIVRVAALKSKVEALEFESTRLKDFHEDLTRRVKQEELQPHRHRLKEVEGWLDGTRQLTLEASQIVENGKKDVQSRCIWDLCPQNCIKSYKITGKVEKMLVRVKEALESGRFENVTWGLSCPLVEDRPAEKTVGLDTIFKEAWRWVDDEDTRVVGLYGVGDVGKTTLLTTINNHFLHMKDGSKLVIWVTVTKQGTVEDVQEVIQKRVVLKDDNWERKKTDEKAIMIHEFLKEKHFVLLLDDLWEHLDLCQVGIPNTGKIVFTTRFLGVCRRMEARKTIEVTCLEYSEAEALFNAKVREETLKSDPQIPLLAKAITEKCGRLPIALKTIGRAMSGKTDPGEWRRAIRVLSRSLRSNVYPLLKLSYDNLGNETIKRCFLYCALFPQGYDIPMHGLIGCWIAERLIPSKSKERKHEEGSTSEELTSEDKGFDIIESLRDACLLEKGDENERVKMHDVVRDMALWIARKEGKTWDQRRVEDLVRLDKLNQIRAHANIIRAAFLFKVAGEATEEATELED